MRARSNIYRNLKSRRTASWNSPRVISGALLDQYDYWAALNALNLYYVNSHFIHPDDVLDEDRGAALGWETLHENLGNYMDWLYTSAPNLRNLTASEASCATERYDVLSVECTPTQEGIHLRLTASGMRPI